GQSVGHRVRGVAGGGLHRVIGRGQASQVGDVLAQGVAAVELLAVGGGVAVELRHQLAGTGGEAFGVGRAPPVLELAGRSEAAALVVVAVGHLVADHRADAAVVHLVGG